MYSHKDLDILEGEKNFPGMQQQPGEICMIFVSFCFLRQKRLFFCVVFFILNPCGVNLCSLVEIHHHHPIESTVLVETQLRSPFRGIFQNLNKIKIIFSNYLFANKSLDFGN